jgi:hypothetical protein
MGDSNAQESPTPTSLREQIKEYFEAIGHTEPFDWDKCAADYTDQILSLVTTYVEAEKLTAAQEAVKANNKLHELHERNIEAAEIDRAIAEVDELPYALSFGDDLDSITDPILDKYVEERKAALQAQKAVLESKHE